jgi:histidinol-phosphate aminotransferase
MVNAIEVNEMMAHVPDDVIVVFDEAYYEYVRDREFPGCARLRQARPTRHRARTFSKIYGLAGLRIGYGLTTPRSPDISIGFGRRSTPTVWRNGRAGRAGR